MPKIKPIKAMAIRIEPVMRLTNHIERTLNLVRTKLISNVIIYHHSMAPAKILIYPMA